mmetsp:Transcript_58919/g.140630  ORF Transcript_58919/g.140630 Transcript_58919/m.140630 type:complete len:332 (-) Transcript_58919:719-1714(-)
MKCHLTGGKAARPGLNYLVAQSSSEPEPLELPPLSSLPSSADFRCDAASESLLASPPAFNDESFSCAALSFASAALTLESAASCLTRPFSAEAFAAASSAFFLTSETLASASWRMRAPTSSRRCAIALLSFSSASFSFAAFSASSCSSIVRNRSRSSKSAFCLATSTAFSTSLRSTWRSSLLTLAAVLAFANSFSAAETASFADLSSAAGRLDSDLDSELLSLSALELAVFRFLSLSPFLSLVSFLRLVSFLSRFSFLALSLRRLLLAFLAFSTRFRLRTLFFCRCRLLLALLDSDDLRPRLLLRLSDPERESASSSRKSSKNLVSCLLGS